MRVFGIFGYEELSIQPALLVSLGYVLSLSGDFGNSYCQYLTC